MAERRMFARAIIGSARFLRMPSTSRLLYYDLGMDADDDGCVEAFAVIRKTGASEDDLRVLVSKGFVRVLNDDLVSLITDWRTNNQIRKDRYHEGVYKGLIGAACNVLIEGGNQLATKCQPTDNQMGDNLATESSIVKASIVYGDMADKPPTHPRFSPPSVQDVEGYCQKQGYSVDAARFVDFYTSKGWMVGKNPMKDWKAAVRTWSRKDNPSPATPKPENCGYIIAPTEDPYELAVRRECHV